MIEKVINQSIELKQSGIQKVKVWYSANKEKTIEELYHEAYGFVNTSVYSAVYQLDLRSKGLNQKLKDFKLKIMELKENLTQKFNLKIKMWNSTLLKNVKIWNTTAMAIAEELVSVYNQTAKVTSIAGRQLVLILRPTFKILKNRTVVYLVQMKNVTLPLVLKAQNFTLLQLEKAKNYSVAVYNNITSSRKFKEFVVKYEVRQKVNKSVEYVKKICERAVKFVEEFRPIDAILFVNVTLPKLVREKFAIYKLKLLLLRQKCQTKFQELKQSCLVRYESLKQKYQEIASNPKAYAAKMYRKVNNIIFI